MTNQEFFDACVTKLYAQGQRCAESNSTTMSRCLYFKEQDDGTVLGCAVGIVLPPELAKQLAFDNFPIDEIVRPPTGDGSRYYALHEADPYKQARAFFSGVDRDLLHHCQSVHDGSMPASWRSEFGNVAARHGLNTDALKTAHAAWLERGNRDGVS